MPAWLKVDAIVTRSHGQGRPAALKPPDGRVDYSFTAPVLAFMILRWNTQNTIATGMVISSEAASCRGNWLPEPS